MNPENEDQAASNTHQAAKNKDQAASSADHAVLAAVFNQDEPRVDWHDRTLWWIRQKRDGAAWRVPGWEALRDAASGIKDHVLSHLSEYLLQFERQAEANGIKVHWAADAAEHNAIVVSLLRLHGVDKIVKSKSMLTEECHLYAFLEQQGVEVVDTDLGERIVQLAGESPSHIVLPCIHKKKERGDRRTLSMNIWVRRKGMPIRSSWPGLRANICVKNS